MSDGAIWNVVLPIVSFVAMIWWVSAIEDVEKNPRSLRLILLVLSSPMLLGMAAFLAATALVFCVWSVLSKLFWWVNNNRRGAEGGGR